MTIPKIPDKRAPKFPDPKIHKAKKQLHCDIRDTLMKLYSLCKGGRAETIMKFIGMINPGPNPDPDRLPYLSLHGRAKHKNKMECIFAIVSDMILSHWKFCEGGKDQDRLNVLAHLTRIQKLIVVMDNPLGLQVFNISGDVATGYELSVRA